MSNRFEQRHVIVTGGGRGIGEATARRFAAEGADVLVISRTEGEVAGVAEAIRAAGGSAWHARRRRRELGRCPTDRRAPPRSAGPARSTCSSTTRASITTAPCSSSPRPSGGGCSTSTSPRRSCWAQRVARAMASTGGGAIVHIASIDALGTDGDAGRLHHVEGRAARPQPQPLDGARAARDPLDRRESRVRRDAADPAVRRGTRCTST